MMSALECSSLFVSADTEKNFGIKFGPDTAGFLTSSQASCCRKFQNS